MSGAMAYVDAMPADVFTVCCTLVALAGFVAWEWLSLARERRRR